MIINMYCAYIPIENISRSYSAIYLFFGCVVKLKQIKNQTHII